MLVVYVCGYIRSVSVPSRSTTPAPPPIHVIPLPSPIIHVTLNRDGQEPRTRSHGITVKLPNSSKMFPVNYPIPMIRIKKNIMEAEDTMTYLCRK